MSKLKKRYKVFRYVAVEGLTEKKYLERLRDIVNDISKSYCLNLQIPKPQGGAGISVVEQASKMHIPRIQNNTRNMIFDTEQNFKEVKRALSRADELMESKLVYLNTASVELWILLHKFSFDKCINPKNYCILINEAFKQNFQNLKEFKREDNLDKVMKKISFKSICMAIQESNKLRKYNENNYNNHIYDKDTINKISGKKDYDFYYNYRCDTNMDKFIISILKEMRIKIN